MSVLRFPRIYFRGEMSWDPCLANNTPDLYDAVNVQLVLPQGVTLDEYKQHVMSHADKYGVWNYYGTHDARFEKVVITGGALAPHQPTVTDDPLVGRPVSLWGKLVDVDPTAVHTSQIFFDEMSLGDETQGFAGLRMQRMHSRWINFSRSLPQLPIAGIAGVVWQTTFEKSALQLFGLEDSALLKAFGDAFKREEVAGLMVRFQTFRTLYFQNGIRNSIPQQPRTTAELIQLYVAGQNFSNPAYSALVGVAGLWLRDEAVSAPSGRYLVPAGPIATATRRGKSVPATAGPAVCELDEETKTLSFDFGSTFPEKNQDGDKEDVGSLAVVVNNVVDQQVVVTPVVTLDYAAYAKPSYDERAGIIDIDLSAHQDPSIVEKVRDGSLAVNCIRDGKSVPALTESEFLVIADQRGLYLNEGDKVQVRLHVLRSGRPAPAGTKMLVNSYDTDLNFVSTVTTLTLKTPGAVDFPCAAEKPSLMTYQFLPFDADHPAPAPPFSLDQMSDFFIAVRTLPFDDALAKHTHDAQLTWSFVYNRILRVYDSFNPIMSRTSDPAIYKPLDDQSRMETLAEAMRRVASEETFESRSHMPVTRDMSRGRRRLLLRWCELVREGKARDMDLAAAAFDKGLAAALHIPKSIKDPRMGTV